LWGQTYIFYPEGWPDIAKKIKGQDYQIFFITEEAVSYLPQENDANIVILLIPRVCFLNPEKPAWARRNCGRLLLRQ